MVLLFAFSVSAIQASDINSTAINSTNANPIQFDDLPHVNDACNNANSLGDNDKNQTELLSLRPCMGSG